MDLVSGIVVYILLWWFAFFLVLPIGVRVPEQQEDGHADSAPANPNIPKKLIAATLLGAVMWVIVWGLIEADLYSFRESVKDMF